MFDFGLGNTLLGLAGSLGGSALGLIGSLGSSAMSAKEAKKTRQMQWQMWQEQKDLALNAHKYEVQDLRNAGLNPILSASGGSGISVPSGSVTSTPGGLDFSGAGDPVAKAVDLAFGLQKMDLLAKQIEGVSSANEGQRLENESRKLDNNYKAATNQYEIDRVALGPRQAAANLEKAFADAKLSRLRSDFWSSLEGRRLFSAQETQKAFPKTGNLPSIVINSLMQGVSEADHFIRDIGVPFIWKRIRGFNR